jgi:hypothetical protein
MRNDFRAGLRNGLTIVQYRRELARRHIAAVIAHARWAGRHLANVVKLQSKDNKNVALLTLDPKSEWVLGTLQHGYCVDPILLTYAAKVAREHV